MAKMSVPILVDWESIKDYLEKADIVEVVRCKECKHYNTGSCVHSDWYYAYNYSPPSVEPDDYCSRAERKTEHD